MSIDPVLIDVRGCLSYDDQWQQVYPLDLFTRHHCILSNQPMDSATACFDVGSGRLSV